MGNGKILYRPVINISPADVIAHCANRRQKPTTSEARRWLRRHTAEIEEAMCSIVKQHLDDVLDDASIAEYPDPRMDAQYRIVDSAIGEAISKYCEILGHEDCDGGWDGAAMLEVLEYLLDHSHGKGIICMPYTVGFGEPYTSQKHEGVVHRTERIHISFDNGKLIAELGKSAKCHHEGSVFVPICNDN